MLANNFFKNRNQMFLQFFSRFQNRWGNQRQAFFNRIVFVKKDALIFFRAEN